MEGLGQENNIKGRREAEEVRFGDETEESGRKERKGNNSMIRSRKKGWAKKEGKEEEGKEGEISRDGSREKEVWLGHERKERRKAKDERKAEIERKNGQQCQEMCVCLRCLACNNLF